MNASSGTPTLISLVNCDIRNGERTLVPSFSWNLRAGEHWLVTGQAASAKSQFGAALTGALDIVPGEGGRYSNMIGGKTALVSFETAAALMAEERALDDSDFVEGGIDDGRTPRILVAKALAGATNRFDQGAAISETPDIDHHPAVVDCRLASFLDRGLKYLSTGEIRRTVLCLALVSNPDLLVIDEPFEGLDAESRVILSDMIRGLLSSDGMTLVVIMARPTSMPDGINRILEFDGSAVSYSGPRDGFRPGCAGLTAVRQAGQAAFHEALSHEVDEAEHRSTDRPIGERPNEACQISNRILVEMRDVFVEWSGRRVLDGLSWSLREGEHWLIQGPNGSGKTTFLELITGDNMQVYRNDVRLFGSRRGSGETIWEIKEKMGIVSYRLHLEYRMVGDLDVEGVVISGLHDSIGLYQARTELERQTAERWLALAGLSGRGAERFSDLSYGEQRALLIVRAAIKRPPILIMDEPCQGLDTEQRDRVLDLLQTIAEKGVSTILHVTHDPEEILPCERRKLELLPGQNPMYRITTIV